MQFPSGYLLPADEDLLLTLATGCHLAVDLGTCCGRSAVILSQRCEQVVTVDIFENVNLIQNEGSRAHYKEVFANNPHNFADVKLTLAAYPNITVVNALTHEQAKAYNDRVVDLIFFDADHSYTGLLRDYIAWFSKVKPGGILAFHDATDERWDVKELCDMLPLMDGEGRINREDDYSAVEEIPGAGCIRVFRKL